MSNYVTAADTRQRFERRGIRAGRRLKPAPVIAPGRLAHAYRAGDARTFCGKAVDELYPFPDNPFEHVNPNLACPECLPALDG